MAQPTTSQTNQANEQVNTQNKKAETPFESLSSSITGMGSRLRVLEERYSNIRKKTQMTDQNLLDFEKDIRTDIKSLNVDLLEIKRSVSEINENLIQISAELKKSVRQPEFRVVEKYVDMWQPMNFLTKDEFARFLKQKNK